MTAKSSGPTMQTTVEEELCQAEDDFARGDCIELTVDELDRCVASGRWPWQRASCE